MGEDMLNNREILYSGEIDVEYERSLNFLLERKF